MKKMRLIQPSVLVPRYRMIRMAVVAAEFSPYIEVEINDENIESLDLSETDFVGLTCQSYNAYRAFYISEEFRKRGVKTILGGVFATAMPDAALEHFDSVVVGEVEGLGKEIIDDLEKGTLKRIYKNEAPPDIASTNMPRLDLLKNRKYYKINFPLESSRGCPHSCSFCFVKYQYPAYRKRSLADIERDLSQWDYGAVELIDHHCAADKHHLYDVCEIFKSNNVVSWIGEATLMSLNDDETLKRLSDSNCRMIFVGMESISEKILSGVNKGFNNVNEYKRIIKKCQENGIFIHAGLIWGLDGKDDSVYRETLKFSNDSKIYLTGSNIVTYLPGTDIYNEHMEKGQIISEDLRDYDSEHITVMPEGFNAKVLLKGIKYFQKRIYSLTSIFKRAFQLTNRNLTLLIDYLGFNFAYRSYYRDWTKRVTKYLKEIINIENKGEKYYKKDPGFLEGKDSFPHRYRDIPKTYFLLELNWRYWEFWLQQFIKVKKKAGILFSIISVVLFSVAVLNLTGGINFGYSLPGLWKTAVDYILIWMVSELIIFTASKWIKSRLFLLISFLVFALPILIYTFTVNNLIAAVMIAYLNNIFVIKNISYINSTERKISSFLRYHLFMVFSLDLSFNTAFELDMLSSTFKKAFKFLTIGIVQVLAAAGSFWLLFVIYFNYPEAFTYFSKEWFITVIIKGIFLYTAIAWVLNIFNSSWVVWGYKSVEHYRNPLLLKSPADFWRRFEQGHYKWALWNFFYPVMKKAKANRGFSAIASLIPFLIIFSMVIYVLSPILIKMESGIYIKMIGLFYLIHYFLVVAEQLVFRKLFRKEKLVRMVLRPFQVIIALILLFSSSALFFYVTDNAIMYLIRR